MMRLSLRSRQRGEVSANRRKQEALAERIASALMEQGYRPQLWQVYFDSALKEIARFDKEFEEVRA